MFIEKILQLNSFPFFEWSKDGGGGIILLVIIPASNICIMFIEKIQS